MKPEWVREMVGVWVRKISDVDTLREWSATINARLRQLGEQPLAALDLDLASLRDKSAFVECSMHGRVQTFVITQCEWSSEAEIYGLLQYKVTVTMKSTGAPT